MQRAGGTFTVPTAANRLAHQTVVHYERSRSRSLLFAGHAVQCRRAFQRSRTACAVRRFAAEAHCFLPIGKGAACTTDVVHIIHTTYASSRCRPLAAPLLQATPIRGLHDSACSVGITAVSWGVPPPPTPLFSFRAAVPLIDSQRRTASLIAMQGSCSHAAAERRIHQ